MDYNCEICFYHTTNTPRSYTVFTVTVHIKEDSRMGEQVLRRGKLNLVDPARRDNFERLVSSACLTLFLLSVPVSQVWCQGRVGQGGWEY